jgi:SAM-dependent methyltransferase
MNSDLVAYYKERAKEYEKIYDKPERQADLAKAASMLQDVFRDRGVFEIACGTGYWTERIAYTAKTILATDINDAVIEIARAKNYSRAKVRLEQADLYHLGSAPRHESLFAGFILSHIKRQSLGGFIDTVNSLVQKGGTVVFMDNLYVEGSNHPITETDTNGNTYQARKLENGALHRVLKNFFSETFLKEQLNTKATDIHFLALDYFWILTYKTV